MSAEAPETPASPFPDGLRAFLVRAVAGAGAVHLAGMLFAFLVGVQLARGLGVDPDEVASPTFVLLTAYPGRLRLYHADLYRLAGDGDDRELGLEELPGPRGVLAIEWAERLSMRPWARVVEVHLEHAGEDSRRMKSESIE